MLNPIFTGPFKIGLLKTSNNRFLFVRGKFFITIAIFTII